MKRLVPSLILLILLIGSVFIAQRYLNKPEIPKLYSIPAFEFQTQQGIPFSNKNFSGKITVADFIFTNCPGICPYMSQEMAVLYNEYKDSPDIQFVSFSVDPQRDSLLALQNYADNYGVTDNRWSFLRTEKGAIQNLYEQGFKLGGDLPFSHATKFVLIDSNNMIRGYFGFDDESEMEQLKSYISVLAENL